MSRRHCKISDVSSSTSRTYCVRQGMCMSNDLSSCRLNSPKSKQDCRSIANALSSVLPRHTLHARTLERLSSQLESLIVRTEFCHTRINRRLLGTICDERLEGKTMSRNGGGAEEMLALRSSMPRQVEWITGGEEIALSSKFRGSQRAELRSATHSIPVLPEGWAGLYARLCTAITSFL